MSLRTSFPASALNAGLFFAFLFLPSTGYSKSRLATTDVAFHYPVDGGGMLMVSRMIALKDWLHVGGVVGGGVIHRDLEIEGLPSGALSAETDATVVPFIGPQIGIYGDFIGLSLSYGFYHADTTFKVNGLSRTLKSKTSAWGQGFFSPLLNLDFYIKEWDTVAGFGLGGFFGSNFLDLAVDDGTVRVTSKDDPISTLTFHVHMRWADGRSRPSKNEDEIQ